MRLETAVAVQGDGEGRQEWMRFNGGSKKGGGVAEQEEGEGGTSNAMQWGIRSVGGGLVV